MSSNAVIENGKSRVGATFEDNDENIAFTHQIFTEAMNHFVNTSGDPIKVIPYEPEIIEQRINCFLSNVLNPPRSVSAKLYAILQYIKNNLDIYKGIKIYI